jgi:hypothetical protein
MWWSLKSMSRLDHEAETKHKDKEKEKKDQETKEMTTQHDDNK